MASAPPFSRQQGPRDRARHTGVTSLSDVDLIALLLGHGVRGKTVMHLAAAILERVGGLEGLSRAGSGLLADVVGLGEAKGWRLLASVEIGRRIQLRRSGPRRALHTPGDVAACFKDRLGGLDHEELWVVALDGRNRIRGSCRVAMGSRNSMVVSAREILAAAFSHAATSFLLVHNHPSGDPTPSDEDLDMTRRCAAAADVVHMPLIDHVIVTPDGTFTSMLDDGIFEEVETQRP